jgi:hypothetical protein
MAHQRMYRLFQESQFDTTAMFRESNAIRSIGATLSDSERTKYRGPLGIALEDSMHAAYFRQDPRLVEIVRKEGPREFTTLGMTPTQVTGLTNLLAMRAAQVGTLAPAIPGDFWFPDSAAKITPAPGRVTLVSVVEKGNGSLDAWLEKLRRLHKKYGSQGLDIVLVLGTKGYSWSSPPQLAEDEAKTDAWYYRGYFKLPFTVVVEKTPFTTQPDGRRVAGSIAFSDAYTPLTWKVLIGRDGKIITNGFDFDYDAQLDAYVQKALAAHVPTSNQARAQP